MPTGSSRFWGVVKDVWALKPIFVPLLVTLLPLGMVLNSNSKETRCGYTMVVMAALWLTEALPIPVTSLLPIFMLPMLGVSSAKEVSGNYVTDTSMLFLGGLIVAVAVEEWNLHKRIALAILRIVGSQPNLLMLGLMLPTWFLSMWISNTAAAAMMIPIVSAVTSQVSSVSRTHDLAENATYHDDAHLLENERSATEFPKGDNIVLKSIKSKSGTDDGSLKNGAETNDRSLECGAEADEICDISDNNAKKRQSESEQSQALTRLSKALALSIAYAANTGGIATLTGSPPNLVLKGRVDDAFERRGEAFDGVARSSGVTFTSWLLFALPVSFLSMVAGWLWLQVFVLRCKDSFGCLRKQKSARDRAVRNAITKEFRAMGRISFAECIVALMFLCLAMLWIFREPPKINGWGSAFIPRFVTDSSPAMIIAVSMFILPVEMPLIFCLKKSGEKRRRYRPILDWDTTVKKVPWGVILLLGGGFALAKASDKSGLSAWFGSSLGFLTKMNPILMNLILCLIVAAVTEVTSNTATATLLMPILEELSITAKVNPLYLMMSAAVACSFAFMLPVATPPSAIVFSHGYLTIPDMASTGFVMNILAVLILTLGINTWGAVIFDLHTIPEIFATEITNVTTLVMNLTSGSA